MSPAMHVAVLGGGAVGLSTAIRLMHEQARNALRVTVIAELTGDETTSRGAGGLWKPYSLGKLCTERARRFAMSSYAVLSVPA